MLAAAARAVLLAPDPLARAAAFAVQAPDERWMLCQGRDVRRSYVAEVVDRPDDPNAQERWMLTQAEDVRMSYVREVLDAI